MSCNYTCLKNLMCVLGVVEAQRKIPCAARWLWKVSFGARSVFAYGNGCPFLAYGYCVGFRPLAINHYQSNSPFRYICHQFSESCTSMWLPLWTWGFTRYGWKFDGGSLHHGCNLRGHQRHRAAVDVSQWFRMKNIEKFFCTASLGTHHCSESPLPLSHWSVLNISQCMQCRCLQFPVSARDAVNFILMIKIKWSKLRYIKDWKT